MNITQAGLHSLERAEAMLDRAAQRIARLPLAADAVTEDSIELSAEIVALLEAKNLYKAGLKVIETGAELQQATLDLLT